jgi:predicted dehydrogenase
MGHSVKWGILSAGNISNYFAKALAEAGNGELYAVAARDLDRAEAFAKTYGATRAYGSYEALLQDPDVEAVYIATLHPWHLEWMLKTFQAGKHVLCEKPLTMNLREAKLAEKIAKERRCLLREAFMYRHHPQTQMVADLVSEGRIGKVRLIEANFCVDAGIQPESRLQAKELGGGAILDLGCYTMSFARLIAGRAQGRLFGEPLELKAVGHLDTQTKTDMWTTASLRFEGDVLAKLTCAMRMKGEISAVIYGEKGRIRVDAPWFCREQVTVTIDDEDEVLITPDTSRNLYVYQIETFGRELRGQSIAANAVAMRSDDTLGNMKALDWWRAEIGLGYEADRVS